MPITSVLFSFDGRIDRQTYWLKGWLPLFGVYVVIVILSSVLSGVAALILLVPLAWCGFAISAKRWHDRDKSGWWSLIGFVPVVGIWTFIELGFLEGTNGPNRYGPKLGEAPTDLATREVATREVQEMRGNTTEVRGRIVFTGSFWGYSLKGLLVFVLMLILSPFTLGLSLMYALYWNVEYFFAHMDIRMDQPTTPPTEQEATQRLERSIAAMDERVGKLEGTPGTEERREG